MRTYWSALIVVACVLGVSSPTSAGWFDANGQFVGPVNPAISGLLRVFPAGGPGLRGAIARAIEADPALIDDAIFVARNTRTYQQEAVWAGLADAANSFARIGSASARAAEDRIRTALGTGNSDGRTGLCLLCVDEQAVEIPGFTNAGAAIPGRSPGKCVSPSRPGC